mgnify:CR=1 FL=1
MMWTADIYLKSGKNIIVRNLQSINKLSSTDSSITKITDFQEYHLLKGQRLSFVGELTVVTLLSEDIEYIQISKQD